MTSRFLAAAGVGLVVVAIPVGFLLFASSSGQSDHLTAAVASANAESPTAPPLSPAPLAPLPVAPVDPPTSEEPKPEEPQSEEERTLRALASGDDIDATFQLAMLLNTTALDSLDAYRTADEASRDALRDRALALLTEVIDLMTVVVKDYAPRHAAALDQETGELDTSKFDEQHQAWLIQAWVLQADALYERGQLHLNPALAREDQKQAIEVLNEFIWEFEDRLVAFWGYITSARSYAALGKIEDAMTQYEAVLALPVDAHTQGVRLAAYWRYAESLRQARRYDEAIKLLARVEKEYPNLLGQAAGQAFLLEIAQAQHASGDRNGATATALRVARAEQQYMAAQAQLLLESWR